MSEKGAKRGGLTPKQRLFALEYIACLNATEACRRAGYRSKNPDVDGPRMLGNAGVRSLIDEALARREAELQLTAERILRELYRIGTVDVSTAFNDAGGMLPLKEMPEDVRRAISGIEVEEIFENVETGEEGPRGAKVKERVQIGVLRKVKFAPKVESLALLGKHLKLFTDRLEHGTDGKGVQVSIAIGGAK